MKLGKYIHILLQEHETVIVPGLGAFISSYKPAQLNEETEEITPPTKEIAFNRKIRNNDGLLVGIIASKEGITHGKALEKIENERENILYTLDKGETVTLENVGTLVHGSGGDIQFEPAPGDDLLLDAFGLETTSLTQPEEEPEEEEVIEGSSGEEEVEQEDREAESEETGIEQGETGEEGPGDVQEEAAISPSVNADKPEEHSGGRKKRGWLWLLLILIPFIGAAVYVFMFDGKQEFVEQEPPVVEIEEDPAGVDSVVVEDDTLATPDSIPQDTVVAPLSDTAKVAEEPFDSAYSVTPDPSKYYLVSGSFKEKENAEKHLQELKGRGFEPFHLGKQGNFYIVGIDVFNNEIAAYSAQYDFLDDYPDSGVWVFKLEE